MNADIVNRRGFLQSSSIAIAASTALSRAASLSAQPIGVSHASAAEDGLKGRLWKTLKFGMVKVPGSLSDKFKAAKAAGFDFL